MTDIPDLGASELKGEAINLAKTRMRSNIDTLALTCHEARPGHQLEIPISMEVTNLSRFRLYGRNTAFIEGWALYAETLCDEMGVYRTDYEKFAYLNSDVACGPAGDRYRNPHQGLDPAAGYRLLQGKQFVGRGSDHQRS